MTPPASPPPASLAAALIKATAWLLLAMALYGGVPGGATATQADAVRGCAAATFDHASRTAEAAPPGGRTLLVAGPACIAGEGNPASTPECATPRAAQTVARRSAAPAPAAPGEAARPVSRHPSYRGRAPPRLV